MGHAAHQGTTAMTMRAERSVYWPRMRSSIQNRRDICWTCCQRAPSHRNLPPHEPHHPEYPFQYLCIDMANVSGVTYGVAVDRYSGWPIVWDERKTKLPEWLRSHFGAYGVPE